MKPVTKNEEEKTKRPGPELTADEFRQAGHLLVDRIAERLARIPEGPVKPNESAAAVREVMKGSRPLPDRGDDPQSLVSHAAELLFDHSLFNGHPRFFGYITSSPAPIGMLADFLASAVNANCGSWNLAPIATEIEAQTIRWVAELIGFPAARTGAPGVLVTGGNMANFVCFLAARTAKAGWDVRKGGISGSHPRLTMYCSAETHTWIQKAADLFGFGTDAIRWIGVDDQQRMKVDELRLRIEEDRRQGHRPFLVVGTAGTVSTGAVDPLPELAALCRELDLWFHVDGAYGAFAAAVPGAPADLRGLAQADSVAVDPHKWLYAPLEAGCALVKRQDDLRNAFSYHPPYYHFGEAALNFVDHGLQNSRGFRALKVWLALQQLGREGYVASIAEDMRLSKKLHDVLSARDDFDVLTQNLSITTFRYVPARLRANIGEPFAESALDSINKALLSKLEKDGRTFLSNAVVGGRFALRACIVNFHTKDADIEAIPELVAELQSG